MQGTDEKAVRILYMMKLEYSIVECLIDHSQVFKLQRILDGIVKEFRICKIYYKKTPPPKTQLSNEPNWIIIYKKQTALNEKLPHMNQTQEDSLESVSLSICHTICDKSRIPFCTSRSKHIVNESKEKGRKKRRWRERERDSHKKLATLRWQIKWQMCLAGSQEANPIPTKHIR